MKSAILLTKSNSYIVGSLLASGAFGEVKKCTRMKDMTTVVIKIQKSRYKARLKELDPDKCNIVRFHEAFTVNQQLHLVFEHLEKSLSDFVNERQSRPLVLKEIRPVVCQLANAFSHLSTLGLIHTDLKLDNVMLVNHMQQPYQVRLIDFGGAIDVSAAEAGFTMQPIACRSPEISLGLPFTEAIDMWSLGILTATLFLGEQFYTSMTEYETVRNIVESLGQPPDDMLLNGLKSCWYFKRDRKPAGVWRLKTPNEYQAQTGFPMTVTRTRAIRALDDILHFHTVNHKNYADNAAELSDRSTFLRMLKRMLELDPNKRITPHQVLYHPFISGYHLSGLFLTSPHVESCYDVMRPHQRYLDDDIADVLYGSAEQPASGPTQPRSESPEQKGEGEKKEQRPARRSPHEDYTG